MKTTKLKGSHVRKLILAIVIAVTLTWVAMYFLARTTKELDAVNNTLVFIPLFWAFMFVLTWVMNQILKKLK